jgi:hypothetical protein
VESGGTKAFSALIGAGEPDGFSSQRVATKKPPLLAVYFGDPYGIILCFAPDLRMGLFRSLIRDLLLRR